MISARGTRKLCLAVAAVASAHCGTGQPIEGAAGARGDVGEPDARQALGASDPVVSNDIPPRLQWAGNYGYCGEVALISAGMYYGQYASQYDARAIASDGAPQSGESSQLKLGVNDTLAASRMHLDGIAWPSDARRSTRDFLVWVKGHVAQHFPVAVGVFMNERRFSGCTDPSAGDEEYDHIVTVTGIRSSHAPSDPAYHHDDVLTFNDNGLWNPGRRPYRFSYPFGALQANRRQANAPTAPVYSVPDGVANYALAVRGVVDPDHETLPVRVDTDVNHEQPAIVNGCNERPPPMPLVLTVTVTGLQPGVSYKLYRYDRFSSVPDAHFNANAAKAYQSWTITIASGDRYVMKESIRSNAIAAYRAVRASAP